MLVKIQEYFNKNHTNESKNKKFNTDVTISLPPTIEISVLCSREKRLKS